VIRKNDINKEKVKMVTHALANRDVPQLLTIVMERLYVVRNQLGNLWLMSVCRITISAITAFGPHLNMCVPVGTPHRLS
jgi:hypothetical protein